MSGLALPDPSEDTPGSAGAGAPLVFQPGDVVAGDWLVLNRLGDGGFGTAYHVRHRHGDDEATLKVFHGVVAERVAAALDGLCHPHIQRIRRWDVIDGNPVVWCDYVPGRNLEEFLSAGRALFPVQIRDIGDQLLDALGALHDRGFVHRDVRPRNLIYDDCRLTLIDFDVARPLGDPGDRLAGPYEAPDLLGRAHPGVDLFAAGVVLYRLSSGEHPYLDATPRLGATVANPLVHNPTMTARVARLLQRACGPEQDGRLPSAAVMRAAWNAAWGPSHQWPHPAACWSAVTSWLRALADDGQPSPSPSPAETLNRLRKARHLRPQSVQDALYLNGSDIVWPFEPERFYDQAQSILDEAFDLGAIQ